MPPRRASPAGGTDRSAGVRISAAPDRHSNRSGPWAPGSAGEPVAGTFDHRAVMLHPRIRFLDSRVCVAMPSIELKQLNLKGPRIPSMARPRFCFHRHRLDAVLSGGTTGSSQAIGTGWFRLPEEGIGCGRRAPQRRVAARARARDGFATPLDSPPISCRAGADLPTPTCPESCHGRSKEPIQVRTPARRSHHSPDPVSRVGESQDRCVGRRSRQLGRDVARAGRIFAAAASKCTRPATR